MRGSMCDRRIEQVTVPYSSSKRAAPLLRFLRGSWAILPEFIHAYVAAQLENT
jgi:hypothetical protein